MNMEYGINNKPGTQYIAYFLAKIRKRGVLHCLKRLVLESALLIVSNISGILAYPVCVLTKIKFVPFYVGAIGHLCVEPECYIKEERLGMRPKYNSIVLAPRATVANRHLLSYWEGYNIHVINSPLLCSLLKPLSNNRFSAYNISKYVFNYKPLFPEIRKNYYGRPPLLKLTEYDFNRGWKVLENIGMPRGAWFVCVHCREDSYLGEDDQTNRNSDINTYLPAIETIIKNGGWVIRLGDPNMKIIPAIDHVIDYAHLEIKSDWMDVFLSANCKFFLGSNSGLCHLPNLFGVPSAIANCVPISGLLSFGTQDLTIPKLVWSVDNNRYLTFKEALESPASNYRWDSSFAKARIKLIDNSPEEISGLMMEVLDKLNGKLTYSEEDEVLQNSFKSLLRPGHYSFGGMTRVGRHFLRKYKYLLSDVA